MKVFLIGITTAIWLLLICCAPREVNAETPVPIDEHNEMLRPPLQNGKPVEVSIALHIINLADIDEVSERFNLMFYLFAQWHDSRLAFTPRGPAERFHAFMPPRPGVAGFWKESCPRPVVTPVFGRMVASRGDRRRQRLSGRKYPIQFSDRKRRTESPRLIVRSGESRWGISRCSLAYLICTR